MGRGAAGAAAHGGTCLASTQLPEHCAGPGGPAAGPAGARCELGGRLGTPCAAARGDLSLPGERQQELMGCDTPHPRLAPPLLPRPNPSCRRRRLQPRPRAVGMRVAPRPARSGPRATPRPARASPAGLLLPSLSPRLNLPWGCAPPVTLALLEAREAFAPRAGLGPVPLLPQAGREPRGQRGLPAPPRPPGAPPLRCRGDGRRRWHRAPGSLCPRTG